LAWELDSYPRFLAASADELGMNPTAEINPPISRTETNLNLIGLSPQAVSHRKI
jgi:hypothetical protein